MLDTRRNKMQVKVREQNIGRRLRKMSGKLKSVPKASFKEFRKVTPQGSGHAKRNTNFDGKETITADYPYAVPLNNGSSKQAPSGMSTPTIQFTRRIVSKIITGV